MKAIRKSNILWQAFFTFGMFLIFTVGKGQTYHNLSAGSFTQDWSNTSLITVNDDWSGVPSIIGYRGDDITSLTGVDPQTLLGEGTITIDVNANQTNPNTFTTGGVTEFEIADPVVALSGSGTADAPNIVIYVNTLNMHLIHISYNLRDIDGSVDNSIQQVALQYRIGNTGNFTNIPAGYLADASSGPNLATLVTPASISLPADAANQSQLQIRIMTTNAVGNDEWIGIDDIQITGEPINIWLGTTSSLWSEPLNWSRGTIPTLFEDVVIPSLYVNAPEVDMDPATPAECNNLLISADAEFSISPGKALTVYGDIENNSFFVINSDATGIGSLINYGSVSGAGLYQVKNYLTGSGGPTPNGRFWYVGSPIPNGSTGTFSPAFDNRMWYYSEGPVTQGYTEYTDNEIGLNIMQGYVVRLGATEAVTFTDMSLNTGAIGSNNFLTRSSLGVFDGFNLVSNPYPSAINWGSNSNPTSGLTQTNLETTIWYRSNGSFATYNWQGGINANGGQREIPPMQAFWVRVASGNTTGGIQLENTARVHSSHAFYKTSTEENVFRLTVSANNITDETVVYFDANALESTENYDSEKMFSNDGIVPQVYTLTTDNTQTAINSFPILGSSEIRVVPLGISTDIAGTFTLNATNLTDFDANIPVSLEDLSTGIMQDLRQNSSYSFATGIVNNANRFRLHFGSMTTQIAESTFASISVYTYGNTLYVNTPNENNTIDVFDVQGKKVLSFISNQGLNSLQTNLKSGMYLVKVQNSNEQISEKVLITQ